MRTRYLLAISFSLIAFGALPLEAQEWMSPDREITVTVPTGYMEGVVPNQQEGVKSTVWLSSDETIRLGVINMANPNQTPLSKKGLELGIAQEMNGKIVDSNIEEINGFDVYRITAEGRMGETPVFYEAAVVGIGKKVCQVLVFADGKEKFESVEVRGFINSMKINVKKSDFEDDQTSGEKRLEELAGKIGAYSLFILIVLIVLIIAIKKSKKDAVDTV